MAKAKIIIIDDDPDIRDVLNLTLSEEGYEVIEAGDGEEGLGLIKNKAPNLVIVDYNMPKMNGPTLVGIVKKDILLSHMPIIMLTGKGEVSDKVSGINAGADDYMVKPFEPQELLARIKMILRRSERDLDANPLTRLPGNVSILAEMQARIDKKTPFSVAYCDLDKFKVYNDKYGFQHGDEIIRETARLLIRATLELGNPDDFIGHIGGDDFVIVTTPEKIDGITTKIIDEFEILAPGFYNEEDRAAGFIVGKDRKGAEQKFGLLSISIGVVSNEKKEITHVAQIAEIGAELKEAAKRIERSSVVKDKRADSRASY
ncbi:MAG TPA: diguanylate cyclase response regulator [Candidatus Omnitrophica bacterium]|nr:diguanylate cyclase response regulator [Candidatus Omnitrophota bacterium]